MGNITSWTRASSVLAASWAWTLVKVTGAVLWFVRNNREPGIRQGLSHLVLDVERLASLLSMPMCPLPPAGLTDRFPSPMVRLKDPLTLDLPKKIVQNLVKNSTLEKSNKVYRIFFLYLLLIKFETIYQPINIS